MYELFLKIVELINSVGYIGIFIMTFIESTFIPIPAEITLIPAGYLVSEGRMNFWLVSIAAVLGTIGGSLLNYIIARYFGRRLLLAYGRYFMINKHKLRLIEFFFERHGAISTFSGRLLPGIKHFISFPAGLARMDLRVFVFYTGAGGALFNTVLIALGYYIGENRELIKQYMVPINIALILSMAILVALYVWRHRRNKTDDVEL